MFLTIPHPFPCSCLLPRMHHHGDMNRFISWKSLIVIVGVAAVGGAAFLGVRHTHDVRGDTDGQAELTEVYTQTEPGCSFRGNTSDTRQTWPGPQF